MNKKKTKTVESESPKETHILSCDRCHTVLVMAELYTSDFEIRAKCDKCKYLYEVTGPTV